MLLSRIADAVHGCGTITMSQWFWLLLCLFMSANEVGKCPVYVKQAWKQRQSWPFHNMCCAALPKVAADLTLGSGSMYPQGWDHVGQLGAAVLRC